jgi:hypothetical protein
VLNRLGGAIDIYNTGKLATELGMGVNLEDTSVVAPRSQEILQTMEEGGASNIARQGLATAYNLVPARVGGGGKTATEGAAVVKAATDALNMGPAAEGELAVAKQAQAASERGADALKNLRRTMVSDAAYDAMTPTQKKQVMVAVAANRNATRRR